MIEIKITEEMKKRLNRVLLNDPGIGVARHVDAGYRDCLLYTSPSPRD